jgi:hypothetical protein
MHWVVERCELRARQKLRAPIRRPEAHQPRPRWLVEGRAIEQLGADAGIA